MVLKKRNICAALEGMTTIATVIYGFNSQRHHISNGTSRGHLCRLQTLTLYISPLWEG